MRVRLYACVRVRGKRVCMRVCMRVYAYVGECVWVCEHARAHLLTI